MGDAADDMFDLYMGEELYISSLTDVYRSKYLDKNVWLTKDYREIPLNEMDLEHLLNCIKYLENRGKFAFYGTSDEWIFKMEKELNRRNIR